MASTAGCEDIGAIANRGHGNLAEVCLLMSQKWTGMAGSCHSSEAFTGEGKYWN